MKLAQQILTLVGSTVPPPHVVNEMSSEEIGVKILRIYNKAMARDWDTSDLDDIIDNHVPADPKGTLDQQIKSMDPAAANKLWSEFEKVYKSLEASDIADDIEPGDFVNFGPYGRLYVLSLVTTSSRDKYFWVSKEKKDRFRPDARGNSILKSLAVEIIEPAADVDPDDSLYSDEEDED